MHINRHCCLRSHSVFYWKWFVYIKLFQGAEYKNLFIPWWRTWEIFRKFLSYKLLFDECYLSLMHLQFNARLNAVCFLCSLSGYRTRQVTCYCRFNSCSMQRQMCRTVSPNINSSSCNSVRGGLFVLITLLTPKLGLPSLEVNRYKCPYTQHWHYIGRQLTFHKEL